MCERFEAVVNYNVTRILKGNGVEIADAEDSPQEIDCSDCEATALPRAIACLAVAVEDQGIVDRRMGEMQSFKYIAAGVCLRELKRYRLTTFGPSELPLV